MLFPGTFPHCGGVGGNPVTDDRFVFPTCHKLTHAGSVRAAARCSRLKVQRAELERNGPASARGAPFAASKPSRHADRQAVIAIGDSKRIFMCPPSRWTRLDHGGQKMNGVDAFLWPKGRPPCSTRAHSFPLSFCRARLPNKPVRIATPVYCFRLPPRAHQVGQMIEEAHG